MTHRTYTFIRLSFVSVIKKKTKSLKTKTLWFGDNTQEARTLNSFENSWQISKKEVRGREGLYHILMLRFFSSSLLISEGDYTSVCVWRGRWRTTTALLSSVTNKDESGQDEETKENAKKWQEYFCHSFFFSSSSALCVFAWGGLHKDRTRFPTWQILLHQNILMITERTLTKRKKEKRYFASIFVKGDKITVRHGWETQTA